MNDIKRGDGGRKVVLRIRVKIPDIATIGRWLFVAPKNAFLRLINARLRWRMLAAVAVLVLAEIYSVYNPFFQDNSYALGNGAALLPESSPVMAAKVQFNHSEQQFTFNPGSDPSSSIVGQPKMSSASLSKDPKKGLTVTDPTNNVDFKMAPKFNLKEGRQDKDRIVYPFADGSGWLVYTLRGVGVKEDIVLNYSHGDTASYSYDLDLGDSMDAKIEKDGSLGVYGNSLLSSNIVAGSDKDAELLQKARQNSSKDKLLFVIPAPVVLDRYGPANGITSKYSLNGNELTVTTTGMKKGNYPLTIDPSIYVVTASQFMQGNNETNVNFDVDNKLIKKGRTTGARFDSWQTTSSLTQGTWGAQTVPAGGYIYHVGGTYNNGGSATNSALVNWAKINTSTGTVDSANPGSGSCSTWCTANDYNLPDARSNFSLVAYNGYLYAFGGTSANCTSGNGTGTSTYCKTVYIAKIGANGEPRLWHPTDTNPSNWVYWYRDTDLPNERAFAGAVAYNNRMYFAGGRTSSGVTTALHIADVTPNGKLGTWTSSGSTLPSSNQYDPGLQVYNDRLYAIGGASTTTGAPTNSVYFSKINSDGTVNSWTQTSSFTTGRRGIGTNISSISSGYVYISGGCTAVNGSGYCTTTASDAQVASINADGTLDAWSTMSGLSDSRVGHNLVAWRDNIYTVGGCSSQNTSTGDCNSNLLSTIKYGTVNQDGDTSSISQSQASTVGTCTGGSATNCDLPGTSHIGNMLSSAVISNGYLYVIGGCTNNS